jgi:hypothetical protein
MANLQQFGWFRDGQQGVPGQPARYRVHGRIEDTNPETGLVEVLFDATGANQLTYPHSVVNWNDAQRDKFMDGVARLMMDIASGGLLSQG